MTRRRSYLGLAVAAFVASIGLSDLLSPTAVPLDYLSLLALAAMFYALRPLSPRAWRDLFAAMLGLSVMIAVLAVVQIGIMPRSRGPFISANFLGGYAVLHFFLALVWRHRSTGRTRTVAAIAAAANLLSVALAQGRGAILACAAGLTVIAAARHRRRVPWIGAGAVVALVAADHLHIDALSDPRISIWRIGLLAARMKLLLGWGQGGISIGPGFDHFYSAALDCLLAGGIIGLSAGVWMIVEALRAAGHSHIDGEGLALRALIVAWIVNGLFIYDTLETSVPLFIVLAYIGSVDRNEPDAAGFVNHDDALGRARQGAAIRLGGE